MKNITEKIRGVNLGGWLVFEKWITPSLFEGTEAEDEFNLHKTQSEQKILNHYKNFITEKDFKFIKEAGLNLVRIPIGYWVFGDFPPFPKTIEYLDFAFDIAEKYCLKVLIDLHGAPGSQNGYDHSGVVGEVSWDKNVKNIETTLHIITKIAERYSNRKALLGIELLNEPHKDIDINLLKDFYKKGYEIIRNICGNEPLVVISDSFRPFGWEEFFQQKGFKNMLLDIHFYQCFTEENKVLNSNKLVKKTQKEWKKLIRKVGKNIPVIVGEWSLNLNSNDFEEIITKSREKENKKDRLLKNYLRIQKKVFAKSQGWFFWSYKTEEMEKEDVLLVWNFSKLFQDNIFKI